MEKIAAKWYKRTGTSGVLGTWGTFEWGNDIPILPIRSSSPFWKGVMPNGCLQSQLSPISLVARVSRDCRWKFHTLDFATIINFIIASKNSGENVVQLLQQYLTSITNRQVVYEKSAPVAK